MGERMMIISYLRAMKRIINLLAFVLVLLSGISACQKRNVPPPQEELLYDVECFYQQRPDSALQILDTLNVAMLSEKEKAHYGLLKAQTILQLDFGNPEADSLLQLSADYFSRHDEPYFEALTCFNQSRLLGVTLGRETQNEKECTELMLKALHCIDACQHLDPRLLCCSEDEADKQYKIGSLRSQICMGLSSLYASTGFVEESIHYTKMADQFYADHDLSRKRIRTSFTLGNNYLELGEYDACLMYYERGLHFAETVDDDVERAYYYVATNLYYMTLIDYEQYETEEERLQLLRKAVATSRKGLEILSDSINAPLAVTFRAQLNQSLCDGYFELQQYDSALYFGHQTETSEGDDLLSAQTYKYLLLSYLALGDIENARRYADLYFAKTWEFEFLGKDVAEVTDEHQKQLEIQQIQNEQHLKRMRLYLLMATLVIVLLVVVFLFYRHQKENEVKNLRLSQEKLQLQKDYNDKERLSTEALRQRMKTIYKEHYDNLFDRLVNEFNALYPNALSEFSAAHPELNETERAICLLSYFSFRVKEIAYILDLRENTVSKSRLAIKKKTEIEDLAEIVRPFVERITSPVSAC
jgi:DNA-binding CsgD family transcriptional regulator